MDSKIQKVIDDIEKTKKKIARYGCRLRALERLKIELENAGIVAMVRGIDLPPSELEAFARAFMEQRKAAAVPDGFSPQIDEAGYGTLEEDDEIDAKEDSELED